MQANDDIPHCPRHGATVDALTNLCYICRLENDLNRSPVIRQLFASSTPRYRYYEVKAKGRSRRTFEWTTETADQGKYWAVERRWVKVKGGERGKIIRKVGFAQRNKAKARAHKWYQAASAPKVAIEA